MTNIDLTGALELRAADGRILEIQLAGTAVWKEPELPEEEPEPAPEPFPLVIDFEDGTLNGFYGDANTTPSVSTAIVHGGVNSLRVARVSGSACLTTREVTGLVVGQQYEIREWIYRSNTALTTVRLGVVDETGTVTAVAGTSAWIEMVYVFTATAETHLVYTTSNHITSAAYLYIDDFSITEV